MTTRVLGIDLGTTNCCGAVIESGTPFLIPTQEGQYTLPSVVALNEEGKFLVGRLAKRQSVVNPQDTVTGAKRLIGRTFDDALSRQAMQQCTFKCVAGESGDVRISLKDRVFTIQELSAMLLRLLKEATEAHFGEEITQAVITVPAHFNDLQRQATVDAGAIAGLEVLRIINEPTAAALAYGAIEKGSRTIAVYDLGGGTFDVSLLRINEEVVEVIATAGDPFLGGMDFDARIVDWLVAKLEGEHGVFPRDDLAVMQRLYEAAEAAKVALTEDSKTTVSLPFLTQDRKGEPVHVQSELMRSTFESLTSDLVDRSYDIFESSIINAGLEFNQIDEIILVGGMTRVPIIRRRASDVTGKQPSSGVHPDLVVAVGASIQGAMLTSDGPQAVLLDVTPHNLGIMTLGGRAETVIPKDTTIPTSAKRVFTTVEDNQPAVKIVVYQGEHKMAKDNDILGVFLLDGLREAPRGQVQVEVIFEITADGIVRVSAKDLETGKEQAIQVTGSHSLDEDELKKMISDHQEHLLAAIDDFGAA